MKRRLAAIGQIALYLLLFLPAIVLYKNKHCWLISERGNEARDNGFWMFKYLRSEHPEIHAYFVIRSDSPDVKKVKSLGKVLRPGSLKHWFVFIAADVRMSTHLFLFAPAPYVGQWIKRHQTKRSCNIDLQHGITHNTFPSTFRNINGSDLYICGAKPECEWVKKEFGWDEQSAVYTGFARFDGLTPAKTSNTILIMPTWRDYLRGVSLEEFQQSVYFKHWNALLSNPRLISFLEQNDLRLVFYLHYSLKDYRQAFVSTNPRIVIGGFETDDVQSLLKESKLSITDYSSIFFDFAYLGKPLIYYQFDRESFYSKHYEEGFFDHRRDGFGPVAYEENKVVDFLVDYGNKGFVSENIYQERAKVFFPLHDTNNCQRIYEAIIKKRYGKE